jgi:hypothetical protein
MLGLLLLIVSAVLAFPNAVQRSINTVKITITTDSHAIHAPSRVITNQIRVKTSFGRDRVPPVHGITRVVLKVPSKVLYEVL